MNKNKLSLLSSWNIYQVEVIERFSWAALTGILVAYLMTVFNAKEENAYMLYAGTSAATYAIMIIGGYLSDFFGAKRIIYIGLFTKGIGFLLLAYSTVTVNFHTAVLALAFVAVGIGLFKPAPSLILAQVTTKGDESKSYTALYAAINVGYLIGKLTLMLIAIKYIAFSTLFWISTISSFLVIITFYLMRNTLKDIQFKQAKELNLKYAVAITLFILISAFVLSMLLMHSSVLTTIAVIIAIIAMLYLIKIAIKYPPAWVVVILMFLFAPHTISYVQLYTSFLTEAKKNIGPVYGQFLLILNPIVIITCGLILRGVYQRYKTHDFYKIAIGTLLVAISCFIIANWNGYIGLTLTYIINAIGEILISAIGLGVVARYMPKAKIGVGTGVFFVMSSIWHIVGGQVAVLTTHYSTSSVAMLISIISVCFAIIIIVGTYLVNKKLAS